MTMALKRDFVRLQELDDVKSELAKFNYGNLYYLG